VEYFKLFAEMFNKISRIPLAEENKSDVSTILDKIINEVSTFWNLCKNNAFVLHNDEKKGFQRRAQVLYNDLERFVEDAEVLKQCSKCENEYPSTTNYFYQDKRSKDGLRPECITCHKMAQKEYYRKRTLVKLKLSG
jgi:predicted glycosyl hydrolase (DUF1957 family)